MARGSALAALAPLAWLALVAPAGEARAAPDGACGLVLSADPPRLAAGDERTVRLRVSAPVRPLLQASLGVIAGLRAEPGGGWTAEWTAPPAGVPQIAILAAQAGGDCGWVAVPLTGSGDAVVRTRRGASVVVRIAERSFGPATAGADGVALVPVEVPPGVDAVFHGARRIPLELPPVPHLALFADAADAPADRPALLTILVAAVDAEGAPRSGLAPALAVASGVLEPPEPAGPGTLRVRWRLEPGRAAEGVVTARLAEEPPVELRVARSPGSPASVVVRPERTRAVAGEGGPVEVEVTLRDGAGNPTDAEVTAVADAGEAGPAARLGPGAYRLSWTPPARLQGRRRAELTVRAGTAEGRSSLALRPGAPARLALVADEPEVTADGRGVTRLLASAFDAEGNAVEEPPSAVRAGAGTLDAPRPDGSGRFALHYRPDRRSSWTEDEISVELPPLSAHARLRLRPRVAPLTVAASAGLALRPGGWLGLQAGAEATAWRWLLGQEAGLALTAAFTRLRDARTVATPAGPAPFTGEVRTLALLLSAAWRRAAGKALSLRLGAGAGAARVESLVSTGGGPLLPESSWVPALSAALAAGLPAWRGRASLELRGTWLAPAHLASLRGAASPISLSLGYELDAP